jgi:hypothetical protein
MWQHENGCFNLLLSTQTIMNIMKHLLLTIALLSIHGILRAQITYQKLYTTTNNSQANCIRATADGGFISCGGGGSGFWILKADSNGTTTWGRSFTSLFRILSVKQTTDGGYAACGSWNNGQGKFQAMLLKLNTSGAIQWANAYGDTASSAAIDLEQTAGGGFILAGNISSGSPLQDLYIIKTDPSGNLGWAKRFQSATNTTETASGIITKNNQYYISGNVQLSPGDADALLMKIDTAGQLIWTYRYDVAGNREFASEVRNTADGNLLMIGYTEGATQDPDMLLLKADTTGAVIWSKTGSGAGSEYGSSLVENPDQSIVIAGSADSSGNNRNVILIKVTNTGNLVWSKQYGGNGLEQVLQNGLDRSADGGFVVQATTIGSFSSGGSKNIYVIKTNNDGISYCNAIPHTFQLSAVSINRNAYSLPPVNTGASFTLTPAPGSTGSDTTLCFVTALQENDGPSIGVLLYPNPAFDRLTLKCDQPVISVTIFTLDGRKMMERIYPQSPEQTDLDIQHLSAGSYLLQVETKTGSKTIKFNKQE